MSLGNQNSGEVVVSHETATNWARSNSNWDKVYDYLFVHLSDFFVILPKRNWPIAHQVVFHGHLELLKRILGLFNDDEINIQSKANDGKTLLDVAKDGKEKSPLVYDYVERLFAQDELINEAKQNNWRAVTELLLTRPHLVNEKPPYSPYFLLHYVVLNGDIHVLEDLLGNFQCLTNVLSVNTETPLDMAIRLNNSEMVSKLRPMTLKQSTSFSAPVPLPLPPPPPQPASFPMPLLPRPPQNFRPPVSHPAWHPPDNSSSVQSKPPSIGFGNVIINTNPNDKMTAGLINSDSVRPPPCQPQQQYHHHQQQHTETKIRHIHTNRTIIREVPLTGRDPSPESSSQPKPISSSSNEQLMRNLKCYITREIFVDPVIASDGQTYERDAILDWVKTHHCSPTTGAPMDATFRDNNEAKRLIQSLKK